MVALRVTTNTDTDALLEETALVAFKSNLRGQVLCPGDNGYDDARKVYNGMIDKRPAIIARCTSVADVIATVNFAHQQPASVRTWRRPRCRW